MKKEMTKPLYEHDCNMCLYLGRTENNNVDMYYHPPHEGSGETLIIRYSNEPSDYQSGIIFSYKSHGQGNKDCHFYIALKKAVALGFLKEKEYYIGCSEKRSKEEDEKYERSEYHKNYPEVQEFTEEFKKLSKKEQSSILAKHEVTLRKYNKEYKKKHGAIPEYGHNDGYVFSTKEEMEKYCVENECMTIKATSLKHAKEVFDLSSCKNNHFKRLIKNKIH